MEKEPRLRGWASPFVHPTALFIRDYLLEHGEGYAKEMSKELGIDVIAIDGAEDVVRNADILITATKSTTPIVKGE